jgi:hypothetical protein
MSKLQMLLWTGALTLALTACTQQSVAEPTATLEPIPNTPTAEIVIVVASPTVPAPDQCVVCHTNKQSLIDSTAEVIVTETESKGVG